MRIVPCLSMALRDMWTVSFLRDVFREFLGTALFLLIGLSSTTTLPAANTGDSISHSAELSTSSSPSNLNLLQEPPDCHLDPLRVALAFGAALVVVCVGMGEVQLNPAVTLALGLGLRLSPWRAVVFVGAQLLGALAACAILMGIVPSPLQGQLGLNEVSVAPGVLLFQAVAMETAVTFQLVLCVLAMSHPSATSKSLGPTVLGISVMLGHLTAIGYTGCGMNPARSFGPAVVMQNFHNHWVYWVGPCAGAVLAWLLRDVLLWPRWSSAGDWVTEFRELLLTVPHKQPDPEHTTELDQDT
ncbi:lens fiber major intrinsic protein [Clupea harengus]|uniref:Lens fiber major intrinsic protein n=1 Tax=Clupea harengus TaxID=7950 RepID=A0A8M1KLD5_CLUHA|nr:lens fiber major intrinsic protein [Clupea harengus]